MNSKQDQGSGIPIWAVSGGLVGVVILCLLSAGQKMAIGASLSPMGFIVPATFGFVCGTVIGLFTRQNVHARHHLQAEVERRTRDLQDILNLIPYGVAEIDAKGVFLINNKAYAHLIGYSENELVGRTIFELQSDEAASLRLREELRLLVKEQPAPSPWMGQNLTRDGRIVDVEVAWNYKKNDDGEVSGFIFVSTDITERLQAWEQLQQLNAQFQAVLDNFPEGAVFLFDNELNYVLVGGKRLGEHGLQPEDMVGKTVRQVFPEHVWRVAEPEQHKVLQGQESYYEVEFDGRLYANVGVPVIMNDKEAKLGLVIAHDITFKRRAWENLKQSEERFRTLVEDLEMVAVQGYDPERRVVYWNKASERLYGYASAEALGSRLEELIIPESMREQVVKDVTNWLEKGKPIPAGEIVLQHKNGSAVSVYSSHTMQHNLDGSIELFCVDVDLSEIKRLYTELVEAKDAAEASSRAKGLFKNNLDFFWHNWHTAGYERE